MGGRSVITIDPYSFSYVAAILRRAGRHYTLAAGWNKEKRSPRRMKKKWFITKTMERQLSEKRILGMKISNCNVEQGCV
jgi:hypothetical protein